ncbi:MAG: discoidin domain-containing protein, partial [Candidatus Latescibacteria bacterium]|nr:discoidin domain-containing protein [Candidatus Latescibacterota bacterium]
MGSGLTWADVYRLNQRSQWETWKFPVGVLELRADGSVVPVKFDRPINAARNASRFAHRASGGKTVQGGVRNAGSSLDMAGNIIDGDPRTFWKPDTAAPLETWRIEIDLGRATPVTKIRLTFPDREGARPFREFRVFGSDGARVSPTSEDVFSFNLIGGTTRPNDRTVVEYEVKPLLSDATLILGDALSGTESEGVGPTRDSLTVPYSLLQYIRFRADTKNLDAALSEVEVYTFGENIALGTFDRGGTLVERIGSGRAMADGDVNTSWSGTLGRGDEKIFWEWDLGVLFWIDRIVMFGEEGFNIYGYVSGIQNHQLLVSNGSKKLTGAIEYDVLSDFYHLSGNPGQLSYLVLPPRPIRYLYSLFEGANTGKIREIAVFPTGYVAQVEMTSGFIDLGEIAGDRRPKVIRSINWEADLPPDTRVQMRTRSGNTLRERTRYFRRDGTELTEDQYNALVKALRGKTEQEIEAGEDWSEWSDFYRPLGEKFLSPSPRRFVQVMLALNSDRPTVAPTLRSLSIDFTGAFVAGVLGEITPKTALPGLPQTFSYRITPRFEEGDPGFNLILLETPSMADADSLSIKIGERKSKPASVRISKDSLVVELSEVVRRDAVEISFLLTVLRNATLFKVSVGHSQRTTLWQPVDPAERLATTVFLPTIPETEKLITNLSIQPEVLTPNGDGVGDRMEIRFSTLKVEKQARVRIYTLGGGLVEELQGEREPDQSYRYIWSGRDRSGVLV